MPDTPTTPDSPVLNPDPQPQTIYQLLDELPNLSPEQQTDIWNDPTFGPAVEAASYEREMDKAQWPELYALPD